MEKFNNFIKVLDYLDLDYSIGVHGINKSNDVINTAFKIMNEGLKTNGWGGLLSNVCVFGQKKDLTGYDYQNIIDYYFYSDNNSCYANVLIAMPSSFTDREGNTYFLGHFNKVRGYAKGIDEAGDSLPLNRIVEKNSFIPKQFIVGYYYGHCDFDDFDFVPNPNFIGFCSEEERLMFYDWLVNEMNKLNYDNIDDEMVKIQIMEKYRIKDNEYVKQLREFYANLDNNKSFSRSRR